MKKILLILLILTTGTVSVFAQFELNTGLYGGYGTAGSVGLNVQSGYNFSFSKEPLRLALLADLGFGYRYGNKVIEDYYTSSGWSDSLDANDNMLDYCFGLIGEFYFLPFMGIGAGGGLIKCICGNSTLNPYVRASVPFVFDFIKFGVSFDYIILNDKHYEAKVPQAYRVNIFANILIMELVKNKKAKGS
jgi:hypothetical protein